MSNKNYSTFVAGFTAANYFLADDGAQFNAAEFGASVIAYPSALFLNDTSAAAPAAEHWWGNYDSANNDGWSIGIEPLGDAPTQLYLVGKIGTGAATISLSFLLSAGDRAGFCERMMHVQLWRKDNVGYLAVNGNIVARAAVAAYGASQYAPSLGARSGAPFDQPATRTQLGAASYCGEDLGGAGVASAVGSAWQGARSDTRGGYLAPLSGGDWPHRWDVGGAASGITSAITKSAAGALLATPAAAPAVLSDVGNEGPTVLDAGATAVALNRVGAATVFFQYDNPTWFEGGGSGFGAVDSEGLSFLGISTVLLTDAVWPVPADTTFIEYEIIGGGGAGGGVAGADNESAGGGGGGSGARTIGTLAVVPGATLNITVGLGGVPGAIGANPGGNGAASSIGAITAPGGEGGAGVASAAAGQGAAGGGGGVAGVGGSSMQPGTAGGGGLGVGAGAAALGGAGGSSAIAGGGRSTALGAAGSSGGTQALDNTGAGGAGAAGTADGDVAGGAGGSGIVIIRRYGP